MNQNRLILPSRRIITSVNELEEPVGSIRMPVSSLSGRYKIQVVENGRIVEDRPWKRNLILDQGLDWLLLGASGSRTPVARGWEYLVRYCVVGTGTTPTVRDSVAATVTCVGTTATASEAFFEAGDAGRTLKLDSGEFSRIATYNSPTEVILEQSVTAGPSLFAVHYTNQQAMASEVKRTATYLTGTGNCGSTISGDDTTIRRTFDFSTEASPQNYTELGWSWASTVSELSGNTLFSRTLISGGSVTVLAGQQLRVIYDLTLTCSNTGLNTGAITINGWPVSPATDTNGAWRWQHRGMPSLNTSGATQIDTGGGYWFPCTLVDTGAGEVYYGFHPFTNNVAPPAFMSGSEPSLTDPPNLPGFASRLSAMSAYTAGSFTRTLGPSPYFAANVINSTSLRGYAIYGANYSFPNWLLTYKALHVTFDQNQTKVDTHRLRFPGFTMSVSRELVNP